MPRRYGKRAMVQASGETSAMLADAMASLREAIVVFGADGGLLFWNQRYVELFRHPAGFLRVGLSFEAVIRRIGASGSVSDAIGRVDDWVADRLSYQARPDGQVEHRLADGRWIRVEETRSREGMTVAICIDISELKRREASLRLLFESNPVPILVTEQTSFSILAVNDAALRLFGHGRDAMLSLSVGDLCAGGRSARLADGMPWRCAKVDGGIIDLLPYSSDFTHDDRPAIITALVDVTDVRRGEEDLHRTRAFLDSVVETIPSIVFAKDMQDGGRYVLFNKTGEIHGDGKPADVLGLTDFDLFPPDLATFLRERDAEVAEHGVECRYEYAVPRPDGTARLLQTRKVPIASRPGEAARYVLGVAEDITDRRMMEERLARAVRCDDLTGLPNRLAFVEMLSRAVGDHRAGVDDLALLLIDLDDFRVLNDALGHLTGDGLLRAVSGRLAAEMGPEDKLARLGADEFVVIRSAPDAAGLAERLLDGFKRPFEVTGQDLMAGASIGVAVAVVDLSDQNALTGHPGSATPASRIPDPDLLLRHAELALRCAKAEHRGTFRLFAPGMDEEVRRRRAMEQDLRGALARGEFELFYQPQVDLSSEAVSGFEALIRWRHPTRGLVNPLDFIAVAEETGLIVPLGAWVLTRACADAVSWPVPVKVAVNLSPVQFITPGLGEAIDAALAGSGLPPDRLELEITESVRLIDNDVNLAMLHRFRTAGLQVALDDFGTGFASLSYLRAFPFSKIKIDRSFVQGLGSDEGCLAIVRAATRLARDLGMETIAEGVETPLQFLQLRQLGCAVGQGFLFGQPLPAAEVAGVLAAPLRRTVPPSEPLRRQGVA